MTDTAPPEPLSLDEVKLNLRVDSDDEDDLLSDLIVAAREHVEDYTGLVLTPREVVETAIGLGPSLTISAWPIAAGSDIALSYVDRSGVEQPIDAAQWYAITNSRPVMVRPLQSGWGISGSGSLGLSLPSLARGGAGLAYPVTIAIQAGFPTPDDVPATVKRAMHLLIGHFYANREAAEVGQRAAAVELPFGVAALLRRWRRRIV